MLQVDDDILCRIAPSPEAESGPALGSWADPMIFWDFVEGEEIYETPAADSIDLLALHETVLGRATGDILTSFGRDADLHVHGVSANFLRKAARGTRVVLSLPGILGDSALWSFPSYLFLRGLSRERMLRSEESYLIALTSRLVKRSPLRFTVCDASSCMGYNLGLDNRQLLPFFIPVDRGEEQVFVTLLRLCNKDWLSGYLPYMVWHRPPERRGVSFDVLWRCLGGVSSGDVILTILNALAPSSGPMSEPAQEMRLLGARMEYLATQPPSDFAEFLRGCYVGKARTFIAQIGRLVHEYAGQPAYWAADLERVADGLKDRVCEGDCVVPYDFVEVFGKEHAPARVQAYVRRFGQFLQIWPELVQAAKELRRRGRRLALPA
jgi:hypothetical protein